MILFHIKKSFFDGWDNMFGLFLGNILMAAAIGGEALLAWAMLANRGGVPLSLVELVILGAGFVLLSVVTGAVAWFVNRMADFSRAGLKDLLEGLKRTAGRSALFGLLSFTLITVLAVGLVFYMVRSDILSQLAFGLLVWTSAFLILALQHFFPVMVRLDGRFRKILRKCFMLALDNLGYSIYLLVWHLLGAVVTIFTAGLVPGAAGILLSGCVGMRLRVYKYDWLEANPGAKRSALPWDELIKADEQLLGPRSLRGMFFPWKDGER
jgi:uncharacterized membrane protein YesL